MQRRQLEAVRSTMDVMNQPEAGHQSNTSPPSAKLGVLARISSRIAAVIRVTSHIQIDYNRFNEPFADFPLLGLLLDMHGLIFETSI